MQSTFLIFHPSEKNNQNQSYSRIMYNGEEFGQRAYVKFNFHDLVTERKLSRALRDTHVKLFQISRENKATTENVDYYLINKKIPPKYEVRYKATAYTYFLRKILTIDVLSHKVRDEFNMIHNVINKLVTLQVQYMHKSNFRQSSDEIMKHMKTRLSSIQYSKEIENLSSIGFNLNKLVGILNKIDDIKETELTTFIEKAEKLNHFVLSRVNVEFIWSRTLALIVFHDDELCFVAPRDVLLMFINKIYDLMSVLIYVTFSQNITYPANTHQRIIEFIDIMLELSEEYQTDFFTITKSLEGIVNAEILVDVEEWKNTEFLVSINNDLLEDINFNYLTSRLRQFLKSTSPNLKYEIGCLSKIFGHPYVDMIEGSQTMFKQAQKHYVIDMEMVNDSINYIKKNFICNYYNYHKKWPLVNLNSGVSKALTYACLHNLHPDSTAVPASLRQESSIKDYFYIELRKVEEYDYIDQVLPYLKDRTISLLRTEVEEKYLGDLKKPPYTDWKRTRLLLAYLISPEIVLNHREYISKYEDSVTLDDVCDYLIIRVVPKEKEHKVKYRGFGCKTYEDRMRCLSQEKTVVKFLEKYSEDQAMSLDEITLNKRLRTFRTMYKAFAHHKVLYVNIDASKWCGHMRREAIDIPLSQTLDKIYDTTIFGKTQLAYEKTFIYIPDNDQISYWDGQKGGIEGLNQDSWVVVYIAQIKAALQNVQYKYYMICRGDDLRIIFCIPERELQIESLLQVKNRILRLLSSKMLNVGHEIKIQDSYGSELFMTFCKQGSIRDLELSQALRKCQKCYGSNNAFLETLDEYIAASFSNGHSAAKASNNPAASYMLSVFWSVRDLLHHNHFKQLSEDDLTGLMLIPSLCGGFPIIYLHNFYVRAESDLLTPFIDIYNFAKTRFRMVANKMENYMRVTSVKQQSYEALYNDPYCLPIDRPLLPTGFLRSKMPAALERITQNETIQELLEEVQSSNHELVVKLLDSCNILHVKALSVIYQALPKTMLSSILKMFESSRSVLQLLCNTNKKHMIRIIKQCYWVENRLQSWRVAMLQGSFDGRSYKNLIRACPVESADAIRKFAWGKEVVGISMPPMSHMMSYYTSSEAPLSDHVNYNHFTYNVHKLEYTIPKERSEHYSSSGKLPFVGYKTRPGTQVPTLQFVLKDHILNHLKNMSELYTWFHSSYIDENGKETVSNIHNVLEKIVHLYTKEPFETIIPMIGLRRSGIIEHHLMCINFLSSIVPNMLCNRYTQVTGISDTHQQLVHSSDKYKLNLLHILAHSVSILTGELDFGKSISHRPEEVYGVTTNCLYCTQKIVEHPLVFNEKLIKRIRFKPLSALRVTTTSLKIFKETLRSYEGKKKHDFTESTQITLKVAAMGIIMEDFNSYRSTLAIMRSDLKGHLPNPDAIDLLKNMQVSRVNKNTSITELKAISISDFACALSQLITDYIIRKSPRVQSIDNLSRLCNQPGYAYPWYKVIESLSHTEMIMDVFSFLQRETKIHMAVMPMSVSDQAVKIIPLAVSYCLYHDRSPPTFVYVSDLVPEVNLQSFISSVNRAVHGLVHKYCHKTLDPQVGRRRSVQQDIQNFLTVGYWENLDHHTRDRLLAFLKGFFILCYGFLNKRTRYELPRATISETISLREVMKKYIVSDEDEEEEEESYDNDDWNDVMDHEIPPAPAWVTDWDEVINNYNYDDIIHAHTLENTEFAGLYNDICNFSGNYLPFFLNQYLVSPLLLIKLILHLFHYEGQMHPERNILQLVYEPIMKTVSMIISEHKFEVAVVPIVACGQKLRTVVRTLTRAQEYKTNLIPRQTMSLFNQPSLKYAKHYNYVEIPQLFEGNQAFDSTMKFPVREDTSETSVPKYKAIERPFGLLTATYQALSEIFSLFRIQVSSPLKIAAFGVGYGSDLIFFQHMFPGSDVYVTTLKAGNYNKNNVIPHYDPNKDVLNIIDDHLNFGFESATDERTLKRMALHYKGDINFYWSDIEMSIDCTDVEYDNHLMLLVNSYLSNKSPNSFFICKIDIRFTEACVKWISILRFYTTNCYVLRPKCLISCRYLYVCCYATKLGPLATELTETHDNIFIGQEVYHLISRQVSIMHEELNRYLDHDTFKISVVTKPVVNVKYVSKYAPIYWLSLLSQHLNLAITDEGIRKMTERMEFVTSTDDIQNMRSVYERYVFKYRDLYDNIIRALYGENSNLDNLMTRINHVRQCCIIQGFHVIHDALCASGGNMTVNTAEIYAYFGLFISTFKERDTHLVANKANCLDILKRNYTISGIQAGYGDAFMLGVTIGLGMAGWVNFMIKYHNKFT